MTATFSARPLDETTWTDLEELFGRPGGAIVRGCWCMFYRKSGAGSASISAAADNKQQLRDLVDCGYTPGLVGYLGDEPVGWISLGPREDYLKLRRSPVMKPVDDAEVWSIVCTYVVRPHRGKGVQHRLLRAAVDFARDHGVRLLEAYPVDKPERSHDDFMFFGSRSLYERAGFREVVRRSPTRVVMRRTLRPRRTEPSRVEPNGGAGRV
jgi:GNAT superfamily N-acetyltransferase